MQFDNRVQECARALTEGDWDTAEGLLSRSFFGYSPAADEPTAAERIIAILSDVKAAMPDLSLSISNVSSDGDTHAGVLNVVGTHTNPLWGAPGRGNTITWSNPVSIRSIDDRLAVRFDDVAFPDLVGVVRQFGLINPPDSMDQPTPSPVSIPEFLLKVIMTGQAGHKDCSHLDQIAVTEPTTRVCAECFAQGVNWPALRMCLTCGFVGCCDTSRNKHMLQHHQETGHPLMRSIRMDEAWVWCYTDNAFFERSILER